MQKSDWPYDTSYFEGKVNGVSTISSTIAGKYNSEMVLAFKKLVPAVTRPGKSGRPANVDRLAPDEITLLADLTTNRVFLLIEDALFGFRDMTAILAGHSTDCQDYPGLFL